MRGASEGNSPRRRSDSTRGALAWKLLATALLIWAGFHNAWLWLAACFAALSAPLGLRGVAHLRFQILAALSLAALPWFALRPPWRPLIGNLLEVDAAGMLPVTALAVLTAWAVMMSCELTLRYGGARFALPAPPVDCSAPWAMWLLKRRLVWFLLLAAPLVATAGRATARAGANPWQLLAFTAAGLAVAWCAMVAALVIRQLLAPRASAPDLWLAPGWDAPRFMEDSGAFATALRRISTAVARVPLAGRLLRQGQWLVHRGLKLLGPGYWRPSAPSSANASDSGGPEPGHIGAFALMIVSWLLHLAMLWVTRPGSDSNLGRSIPPLAFLLQLGLWISWILPALAFWLDRWRIPTLVAIALMSLSGFWLACRFEMADHYYRVSPIYAARDAAARDAAARDADERPATAWSGGEFPSLEDAFAAWERGGAGERQETLLVVCAAGGGAAASAWTAEVLTRLESLMGQPYRDALFAVSAVSGGSVGALHYTRGFDRLQSQRRAADELRSIRRDASRSSLRAVVWALAGPEFFRFLTGIGPVDQDRGQALEAAWRRSWMERADAEADSLHAAGRRLAAGRGLLTLFNSTVVETGEPFVFAPVQFRGGAGEAYGFQSFVDSYPGLDVSLTTAARMSATFPFVTPVAAPRNTAGAPVSGPRWHLADGAYYDNYGVYSMLQVLRALEPQLRATPNRRIVVVQIRLRDPRSREAPTAAPSASSTSFSSRAWLQNLAAPLRTLINVRGASQGYRNELDLSLFARSRGSQSDVGLPVEVVTFALNDRDTPLSWSLTRQQRASIDSAWSALAAAAASSPASPIRRLAEQLKVSERELLERLKTEAE